MDNIFKFFIKNPRFPAVIAILMVLVGLIAIKILPISQYPSITPPEIVVTTVYRGANAQDIIDNVAVPIENQVNGVEGMLYMTSTSTDTGLYTLTITFDIGVDHSIAQVKVQNRIEQITSMLPAEVIAEGVDVKSQSSSILAFLALESPNGTYDNQYLNNYLYEIVENELERIPGVAQVNILGPQNAMRIWLDAGKVASYGLNYKDVLTAIEDQNSLATIGSIASPPSADETNMVIGLEAKGLLKTVEEFKNIILSVDDKGGMVLLSDVARVEVGADSYATSANYNNKPSAVMNLAQYPGSNALDVMAAVNKKIAELQKTFPEDLVLRTPYNSTTFVTISIKNIIATLGLTFLLVVGIVYLFLQNWRATLIPSIAIPVSLIATFAVIYALGFDINMLTLFALILAIGLVVDDGIIVVERVEYLMKNKKLNSIDASIQAMKDIAGSIVATTFVLLAIFVPVAFMAGITGKIYQQFALTICAAVVLSAINALTLSPMLCSIFLRNKSKPLKVFQYFNKCLNSMQNFYSRIVGFLAQRLVGTFLITALVVGGVYLLFNKIPSSFVPKEDQGFLMGNIVLPENATINQTAKVMNYISENAQKIDGVDFMISIIGYSMISGNGENIGMAGIGLKPWNERTSKETSQDVILEKLNMQFHSIMGAEAEFFSVPAIPGIGNASGLSFQFNAINPAVSMAELSKGLDELMYFIETSPKFKFAFPTFSELVPHYFMDVERKKLASYGINIVDVFAKLQTYLGSTYVNDITVNGQVNQVVVQADFNDRNQLSDVENMYVPNKNGTLVKLKDFITFKTVMQPKTMYRFNLYSTAGIIAQTAEGVSTGSAIKAIEEFMPKMGKKFGVSWTGLSLQEVETQGFAAVLIALALVFSYLFLVMLYESWLIACAVLLTNIFAVLGGLAGLFIMGEAFSIYAQLGVVLLIGLASKNAIMMISFIIANRKAGLSLKDAAIKGAEERYRAVIMTALTFILGVSPMLWATGPGANSQHSIGTTVFFGMLLATLIGVMFIPAYYTFFEKLGTTTPCRFQRHPSQEGSLWRKILRRVKK
ncbi:MAG: efflux RND transporter permease subunit [Alphaproteobacteria bacterium]